MKKTVMTSLVFCMLLVESCASAPSAAKETIPVSPSDLYVTDVSEDEITLTWSDNSDNETGFVVEQAVNPEGPFIMVARTLHNQREATVPTFADSDIYFFRVYADNSRGASTSSDLIYVTLEESGMLLPDTVADNIPETPGDLSIELSGDHKVSFHWSDNSTNEDGFIIEKSDSIDGAFLPAMQVASDITTAEFDDALSSDTSFYRICAYNSAGMSEYSSVLDMHEFITALKNTALADTFTESFANPGETLAPLTGYTRLAPDDGEGDRWM
jgi:hypothetical protein